MTKLSVNINKVATLRNSRGENVPNLLKVVKDLQEFGAEGITVHPRPDERHIRYEDVRQLPSVITTEFNIEGNPNEKFMELVLSVCPTQVTLVPDKEDAITSDSGWDTHTHKSFLKEIVEECKSVGIRTSIFVAPDVEMVEGAALVGADRVELYTQKYAYDFERNNTNAITNYRLAAEKATECNLGINAGHDLSLENVQYFKNGIPNLLEVSIGHALICESLYLGFENVIPMYLNRLR